MKKKISILTLIALVLGIVFGLVLPEVATTIDFIGTIYVNLLKFLIGPIVFTSISVTIFDSGKNKNRIALKAVILFIIMFVVSFLLSSLIIKLIDPANGYELVMIDWDGQAASSLSIKEIIINFFPTNIVKIFADNSLFAIILFSYMVGFCATKVEKGGKFIEVIRQFRDILYKILEYVMYITPIAVFALISNTAAKFGKQIISMSLRYISTAYICGLAVLLIVMMLPIMLVKKENPFIVLKKVLKVWMISFSTCSSAATLPTTIRVCSEDLGISEEITNVVVPLGCTIHMCGGAVSFSLLGLFCSKLFGVDVTITQYLLMLVSAVIINMSAPGIPNGGVVIGATYLQLLGIPLTFIGFYSGIYKILDMLYTTLNVTGDITANVILSKKLINRNK